ncbi:hypothetical protein NBRC116494_27710 [Aurantivibrio plasticivorans]
MPEYAAPTTFRVKLADQKSSPAQKLITPPSKPLNISTNFAQYQPVNLHSTYQEYRGLMWGNIKLFSGQLFNLEVGQVIVIEASAKRVIFHKIQGSPGFPSGVYLQAPSSFITEVTLGDWAAKSAQRTAAAAQLAEWEVHFIVGFIGASSWAGFALVFGSDIVVQTMGERKRNSDYKAGLKDIFAADSELYKYSPTLRKKIYQTIFSHAASEPGQLAADFGENYLVEALKDEKVTGRAAGAIAAKFLVNPKNKKLTAFFILSTVLMQVATKSATKAIPAASGALKDKFKALVPNIENIDPNNPQQMALVVNELTARFKELGVEVQPQEAAVIISEIKTHPTEIFNALAKMQDGFGTIANAGG